MTERLYVAELPGLMIVTTLDQIRDRFQTERWSISYGAKWCADHPSYPDLCRYCGKLWRKWSGSKLDGHAKCVVGDDFKAWLRDVLFHHPALTYSVVGKAIGVTPAVVRSWTFPIRTVRR